MDTLQAREDSRQEFHEKVLHEYPKVATDHHSVLVSNLSGADGNDGSVGCRQKKGS